MNEYSPAHADFLLNNQPADAVYHGLIWLEAPSGSTPVVGNVLSYDTTNKVVAVGATVASGNIDLKATVKEITSENGATYMAVFVDNN